MKLPVQAESQMRHIQFVFRRAIRSDQAAMEMSKQKGRDRRSHSAIRSQQNK